MIINTPPAIYPRIKKQFGDFWDKGLIITYYPNIYWIGGDRLPLRKVVHENVHIRQQARYGVEKWWDDFISNKEFRLSQEVEAYQEEVKYIRSNVPNKQTRFKLIDEIAKDLSGKLYGRMISYNDALALFK